MARLRRFAVVPIILSMWLPGCGSVGGGFAPQIAVAPDGKSIVFTGNGDGGSDLYVLNLATSKIRCLARTQDYESDPSFAPDGRTLVYTAVPKGQTAAHLFLCNRDGTGRRPLTLGASVSDSGPRFSRDGSVVVFSRAHRYRQYSTGGYVWDDYDIYLIGVDGKHLKRITNRRYDARMPCFGPADEILYSRDYDLKLAIESVRRTGPGRVVREIALGSDTSCSADGLRAAFVRRTPNHASPYEYEVWVMNADGTRQRQVTRNRSYNASPVFSPDGKRIFFLSDPSRAKHFGLWCVSVDGKGLRKIAGSRLFESP